MSASALLLRRRASWWRNLMLDVELGYMVDAQALHAARCRVREVAAELIGETL